MRSCPLLLLLCVVSFAQAVAVSDFPKKLLPIYEMLHTSTQRTAGDLDRDISSVVRRRVRRHLPSSLLRRHLLAICPTPMLAGPSPPPNVALCKLSKMYAEVVDMGLKAQNVKQTAERATQVQAKMPLLYVKEAKRNADAWQRAKKREEKDIAERIQRANRENRASQEERADNILRGEIGQAAALQKTRYSEIAEGLRRSDAANQIEAGHRGERMFRASMKSLREGDERSYRADHADTEDRSELDQSEERSERGVREELGESRLRRENAERQSRMSYVERQQRQSRDLEGERAHIAERAGAEQDLAMMLHAEQDQWLSRESKLENNHFNTIKIGMGGSKTPSETAISRPQDSNYWRSPKSFAVPMGKQHELDLTRPHQKVFSEAHSEAVIGETEPQHVFTPDYARNAFYQKTLQPKLTPRWQRYQGTVLDSAGNEVRTAMPLQNSKTHSLELTLAISCAILILLLFFFSASSRNSASEPLLQNTNSASTCTITAP